MGKFQNKHVQAKPQNLKQDNLVAIILLQYFILLPGWHSHTGRRKIIFIRYIRRVTWIDEMLRKMVVYSNFMLQNSKHGTIYNLLKDKYSQAYI